MADDDNSAQNNAPSMSRIGQYIRDLSFESPGAPGSIMQQAINFEEASAFDMADLKRDQGSVTQSRQEMRLRREFPRTENPLRKRTGSMRLRGQKAVASLRLANARI